MGAPVDYPQAGAIVLFEIGYINVSKSRVTVDYHVRIKILSQEGVEEVGERSFQWHREYDKIKGFTAHTITPDGKRHEVDKKAVFEKEVGDYKQKDFAFPLLEPGCIIEYKYTHSSDRYRYLRPWYFQGDLYTMKSEVTTAISKGFAYNVDFYNVPVQNQKAEEKKIPDPSSNAGVPEYIKSFTWRLENLPPIT